MMKDEPLRWSATEIPTLVRFKHIKRYWLDEVIPTWTLPKIGFLGAGCDVR